MIAPLSDVSQEDSSVFSRFSLIKLHLASLPLASSYSHVAVSSVFCAQNIFFSAQTPGAPLRKLNTIRKENLQNTLHIKRKRQRYIMLGKSEISRENETEQTERAQPVVT